MRIRLCLGGDSLAKQSQLMTICVPGFETVERVVSYQDNLASLIGYTEHSKELIDEIKQIQIDRLNDLRDALITKEDALINKIGEISGIEERLKDWNTSGVDSFFINQGEKFDSLLYPIQEELQSRWFEQEYSNTIIKELNKPENPLYQTIEESTKNHLQKTGVINDLVASLQGVYSQQSKPQITNTQLQNLGKVLEGHLVIKVGKKKLNKKKPITTNKGEELVSIQLTDVKNISKTFTSRLEKIFTDVANITFNPLKVTEDIRKWVMDYISRQINGVKEGPRQAILNELQNNFVNEFMINIGRNESVIKGFLGEIYWTAFWKYITNGKVIPTSKMTITSGTEIGEEVPIDIVFEDIGFQVKNYAITVNSNRSYTKLQDVRDMKLTTFLTERLELPGWVEPVERFFFAYGYNRLISGSHAEEIYSGVEKRFKFILDSFEKQLKMISTARLDKIIRLDREFTSELDNLIDTSDFENQQYNTVYLIGDKVILSSDIVTNIIHAIDASPDSIIDIKLQGFKFTTSQPNFGFQYPDPGSYNPNAATKDQKVRYSIEINLDRLAQNILAEQLSPR